MRLRCFNRKKGNENKFHTTTKTSVASEGVMHLLVKVILTVFLKPYRDGKTTLLKAYQVYWLDKCLEKLRMHNLKLSGALSGVISAKT